MGLRKVQFEWIFILVVILSHLVFMLAPVSWVLDRWFTTDDAFYYYQVARNILAGNGSTFDGFNLTNGYHPLWMLVLLPVFTLAKVDLILPLRLIILLSTLLTAGTGVLIYRILKPVVRPSLAMLAAFFWAFYAPLHNTVTRQGMEIGINAFLVALLVAQTARLINRPVENETAGQRLLLGGLAALALLSRLDNAFLVLAVGLVVLFRQGRRYIYWTGMLIAALISVFLAFLLRFDFQPVYASFLPTVYGYLALILPLKILLGYFFSVLSRPPRWAWAEEIRRVVLTVGLSSLPTAAGLLLLYQIGWVNSVPRLAVLFEPAISLLLIFLLRLLGYALVEAPADGAPAPLEELRASWKRWLLHGLQYSLPVVVTLGAYLIFNQTTFGTAMPVSGQVKHWWGTLSETPYGKPIDDLPSLFGYFPRLDKSPWGLLNEPVFRAVKAAASASGGGNEFMEKWLRPAGLIWLGVLGLGLGLRKSSLRRDLDAVLAYALLSSSMLQILSYTGSSYVNYKPWYWSNESLLAVFLFALSLDGFIGLLLKKPGENRWLRLAAGLAAGWLLFSLMVAQRPSLVAYQQENIQAAYLQEAAFVEKMTPPGSLIGMPGGGATAYFINDRTITNLDGLINSKQYFELLKSWEVPAYLKEIGLDYVMGAEGVLMMTAPYYSIFPGHTELVGSVLGFSLYRYIAP